MFHDVMEQNCGNLLLFRHFDNTGPIGNKPGRRRPGFMIGQKARCLLWFKQKHPHQLVMGFQWRSMHIAYPKNTVTKGLPVSMGCPPNPKPFQPLESVSRKAKWGPGGSGESVGADPGPAPPREQCGMNGPEPPQIRKLKLTYIRQMPHMQGA
jgi:hypothetical protein